MRPVEAAKLAENEGRLPARRHWLARTGGADGNQRLTAATGLVLTGLLLVEGVTILSIEQLLSWHIFVGMLLIPPVLLKLASTGYRAARYYRGVPIYREKGPPQLLLRVLVAPVLVAATLGLFGTGVALLALGPRRGMLLVLHKASFVVWGAAFAIHFLAYVLRLPELVGADWQRAQRGNGGVLRAGLVALALVAGITLALATHPLAGAWLHGHHDFGFDR